jgi:4-deoxy-L-threo-5-hexosulose-uronate ketol-isomerase
VGGKGTVAADGVNYEIDRIGVYLHLGKGNKACISAVQMLRESFLFYILFTCHHTYPNKKMTKDELPC